MKITLLSVLHYLSLSACLHQNKYHTTGQINLKLFPIPLGQQGTPFSFTLRTSEELQAETPAKYSSRLALSIGKVLRQP